MNPILRNTLGVIAAIFVGGFLNSMLVKLNGTVIEMPEGYDPNDMESIIATTPQFTTIHWLIPFIAHAVNALVSAFIAAKIATTKKMVFAFSLGGFVLLGGIIATFLIPAPVWFIAVDLSLAYLPMAWIGGKLAIGNEQGA